MGEDVESVMGGVRMGVNVDIKRTDGEYRNNVRHKHPDKCIAPVVLVPLYIETENKAIVLLVLPSVCHRRKLKAN